VLRDKSLIPLSRQHQHALALCVRVDRAQPIRAVDLPAWQAEIEQHFEQEIKIHFAAEEEVLFPAARAFPELAPLVEELLADHAALRHLFSQAAERCMSPENLLAFGQRLSTHIRNEERQLFEGLQRRMNQEELAVLGVRLEAALKEATQVCMLTSKTTRPGLEERHS
jgi:hemerythrin-like domain-containing protein